MVSGIALHSHSIGIALPSNAVESSWSSASAQRQFDGSNKMLNRVQSRHINAILWEKRSQKASDRQFVSKHREDNTLSVVIGIHIALHWHH